MQEAQRQQCLTWLGIKPLQARHAFVQAAPSFAFFDELPLSVEHVAEPLAEPCDEVQQQEAKKTISHLLAGTAESARPAAQKEPPVSKKAEAELTDKSVQVFPKKFRLRYVVINEVVFIQPQYQLQWQTQQTELRFMRDVALAITHKSSENYISDLFSWPPQGAAFIESDDQSTKDMLDVFFGELIGRQASPFIIVFGAANVPWLLPTLNVVRENAVDAKVKVVEALSVDAYAKNVQNKKLLWQSIRQQLQG